MYPSSLKCTVTYLRRRELLTFAAELRVLQRMHSSRQSGAACDGRDSRRHVARTRPYRPPLNSSYYHSYPLPMTRGRGWRRGFHQYSYPPHNLHNCGFNRLSFDYRSRWNRTLPNIPFHNNTHSYRVTSGRNAQRQRRPKVFVNEHLKNTDNVKYPVISLVSYNLLAQDLIRKNMFLYRKDRTEYLEWEHRKRQLLKEIRDINADIYCFQEVQEEHFAEWYYPELKARGYEGIFQKRTGSYTDGCAMFYLSHKLQILEHKKLLFQKQKGTLIRDNVAIIAKFSLSPFHFPVSTTSSFCVATTHLLFNHKAGEIKLSQVCYLMAELNKMASQTHAQSSLPAILCGDFNCLPHSPLVNFLLGSRLDYSNLDAWDICGYKTNQSSRYRQIPVPLLLEQFGISQNCHYETAPSTDKATLPDQTTANLSSTYDASTSDDTKCGEQDMTQLPVDSTKNQANRESVAKDTPNESSQGTTKPRVIHAPILRHPFRLESSYPIPRDRDHSPTVTTYHCSACETVDYILYTPSTGGRGGVRPGFNLVGRTALPSQHTLRQYGPQPNHVFSSDHLYLQVDLQLVQ